MPVISQSGRRPSSWFVTRFDATEHWLSHRYRLVAIVAVFAGILLRLYFAGSLYLNPDEAMYVLFANQHPGEWRFWRWTLAQGHPPLSLYLVHFLVQIVGLHSELALRFTSVVTGAAFPWFAMRWVGRFAGAAAALCALFILTFSPALIDLSAELRYYTLAFLFMSIAMNLLEEAIARFPHGGIRMMIWFHVVLYLAIVTEYPIVWYVLASGIYSLHALWRATRNISRSAGLPSGGEAVSRKAIREMWITWGFGQSLALGLYLFLYLKQITRWSRQTNADATNGWLRSAFLKPGDHIVPFVINHTVDQFRFLFGNDAVAIAAALLFLLGVFLVCRRYPWLATMLVVPFAGACAAALLGLLPYAATRHSAFLTIFSASGIAFALAALLRNRVVLVLLAAIVLVPAWDYGPLTTGYQRQQLSQMRDALEFMRTTIPPGALVVTDMGTDLMLRYYFRSTDYRDPGPYLIRQMGGLRFLVFPPFEFAGDRELKAAFAKARSDYPGTGAVWVATGGFVIRISNPNSNAQTFQKAIAVFEDSGSVVLRDPPAIN